jgi:hypothetical protein
LWINSLVWLWHFYSIVGDFTICFCQLRFYSMVRDLTVLSAPDISTVWEGGFDSLFLLVTFLPYGGGFDSLFLFVTFLQDCRGFNSLCLHQSEHFGRLQEVFILIVHWCWTVHIVSHVCSLSYLFINKKIFHILIWNSYVVLISCEVFFVVLFHVIYMYDTVSLYFGKNHRSVIV